MNLFDCGKITEEFLRHFTIWCVYYYTQNLNLLFNKLNIGRLI